MEPNGWLAALLNKMDEDISEIKGDVKSLKEAKWKMDGATVVLVAVVTIVINGIAIFLRV